MAGDAVRRRGVQRNVIRRLARYGSSAGEFDGAVVTGEAGVHAGHLHVIEDGGRPAGSLGANACGVAVFAQIGRRHVRALLTHGLDAIVTTDTTAGNAGMVEIRSQPIGGKVAIAAFQRRRYVVGGLAGGLCAVVTNDAKAGHAEGNLGVIDGFRRIPTQYRVARIAELTRGGMGRSFALCDGSVVTADAAAHHLGMVEMHTGTKRSRIVACDAVVRALYMGGRLRRRVVGRSGDMADPAVARRPLEYGIEVAGFTRQVPVYTVQFEAGRQVIEGHRDGRRVGRPCGECWHREGGGQRGPYQRRNPPRCSMEFHGQPTESWRLSTSRPCGSDRTAGRIRRDAGRPCGGSFRTARMSSPCPAVHGGSQRIVIWHERPAAENEFALHDRIPRAASHLANDRFRISCRGRPCGHHRSSDIPRRSPAFDRKPTWHDIARS